MRANSRAVSFDPEIITSSLSYDECVKRLAYNVSRHDHAQLEEVAYLISQLAVVIE
jgi:hypothetical protein